MPEPVINILIVDDHRIFIEGLTSLLSGEKRIQIVAAAANGDEALDFLSRHKADLVITDITMPGMQGTELVRQIKEKYPEIKTLVLSMHNDSETVEEVLESESEGYLLKNTGKKELLEAIERIYHGGSYYGAEITRILLRLAKKETSTVKDNFDLTPREIEIIRLIVDELTSAQIAEKLFISLRTVETHRKNIIAKVKCSSVVGLIKFAYQQRIV